MITAVLDTNVLASGLGRLGVATSPTGEILRAWFGRRFVLVVSDDILGELRTVLSRRYFLKHEARSDIAVVYSWLENDTIRSPSNVFVSGVAPHAADHRIVAAAVSARADFLVTGDRELREVSEYLGVRFVTPHEFLAVLERAPRELD